MTDLAVGIGAKQFQRLLDQLPVVVWSTDTDLQLTSRWGGVVRASGYEVGEVEGPSVTSFVDPPYAGAVVEAHQAALRGASASYEARFRGRSFTAYVEPLADSDGRIRGVVGLAFDVTDSRNVETALRDSEARLRTIIESEPDCVTLLDRKGLVLEMNPAGLAMIDENGIANLRGRALGDLVVPTHRKAFVELHQRVFKGESGTLEFEIMGARGVRRWLSMHVVPLRDASGGIQAALGIARDISRRRIAELALVESEERFGKAFYANALPLLITRLKDGVILDANEAFERLINRSRDDIVGKSTVELGIIDADRRAALIEQLLNQGRVSEFELELHPEHGESRIALLSLVRIVVNAQECTLTSYRDVTEAKRAEEQLRASRAALRRLATRQQNVREDERTRIAREIHDSLGQALTALKLQLVAAQDAASKDAPALGERLCETAQMVDDLVKSVRRIATDLRPPILDQLGLPAALEWLAQDFSRRTNIRCHTTIRTVDEAISPDLATALFRIVQEALTNVLRHARATRVDLALGVKGDCVSLEINDDGSGITEAGTMGPGSLGILGMRERASALGGVLEVAPRAGGGTRVAAWFPAPR